MHDLAVDTSNVLWHRLRANNLAERLPRRALLDAAFAGLQDSAPRAATVALHARVNDVSPADWEDSSLAQTWAPRGAVFVVPRSDLAVFTRGIAPRNRTVARDLESLCRTARRIVQEGCVNELHADLGPVPPTVLAHFKGRPVRRLVLALAGVQIRWDARTTRLVLGPEEAVDQEQARRELARRFLRSVGPASSEQFARWAAVSMEDANATFRALASETVPINADSGTAVMLADDFEGIKAARPADAVRVVTYGDPILQPGCDVINLDQAHRRAALPPWACTGLVLAAGRPVASWGRSQRYVTLLPLTRIARALRESIESEASSIPTADRSLRVNWRS